MDHVRLKTRSLGPFLKKTYVLSRRHSLNPIFMKLWRMYVVIKSRPELKMGNVGSKSRSLCQFLETPCVLTKRHTFDHETLSE